MQLIINVDFTSAAERWSTDGAESGQTTQCPHMGSKEKSNVHVSSLRLLVHG